MNKLTFALLIVFIFSLQSNAASVFEERFDYKTESALRAAWERVGNTGSFAGLGNKAGVNDGRPYGVFSNSLQRRQLPVVLKGSWKVSFKVLHTDLRRGTWLGLFDAAGKRGYAVLWDSGNPASGTGNGSVSVRKFDLTETLVNWSETGKMLGKAKDSGHVINQEPFAQFEFSWNKATGQLQVLVDGVQVTSVVDKDFDEFAAIYIRGNQSQYYADIVVSEIQDGASK